MGRAHRCGRGVHGDGWDGPYGDGVFGRDGRRRWMMRGLFRRIDATPAQERAIVAEMEKLEDRVHAAKAGVHDARGDLAAAVRGPVLDDAALGAVLGRVDAAIGEVRSAMIDALRGVHGVLDDRQRSRIADLVERRGGWRRGPGPGPGPAPVQL